jgi:hypothetical protein
VKSAQWASSATPDQLTEARAIRLLETTDPTADFPVETTVEWNPPAATKTGSIRVVAKLDAVRAFLPFNGRGQFRVTLGVQVPNRAYAVNSVLPDYDLKEGTFRFRAPITVPADATAVVLVIEELNSGLWGSSRISVQ